MNLRYGIVAILVAVLFVVPTSTSMASTVVITTIHLDNVPDVACDEVWVQDGVDMYFTHTVAEDCDGGGNCSFAVDPGGDGVWLWPARLVADFGESYDITKVEVDINDNCGTGCTKAFLYKDGVMVGSTSNTSSYQTEILTVVPLGGSADMFAVSSCEGQILGSTIRIYATALPTAESSWSVMKSQYR